MVESTCREHLKDMLALRAASAVKLHTSRRSVIHQSVRTRSTRTVTMSASREVISTEEAPGAVGPYSQAIKANGMVYVSGQVALVPGVRRDMVSFDNSCDHIMYARV